MNKKIDEREIFLRGKIVNLKILTKEDIYESKWYGWFNDEEACKNLQQHYFPNSIENQISFWEKNINNSNNNIQLGIIKKQSGKFDTDLTDKANLHPYGSEDYDEDFIPFKFKDVVNNKFIVFRAILGGISDSISPDWSDERFIGRPDKVFVYKGADRTISFDFDVYPKTKQELPVLWDKLNYLVGLCYPAWNQNKMVAPFIELTLGDMYNRTPGFLASLSIASQESSTWELDKGLKVPKYLKCSCSFRYIGKYKPSMIGKHFDFDWIRSDHEFDSFIKNPATTTDMTSPDRNKYKGLFPVSQNPAKENGGIGDGKKNEEAVKG